MMSPVSDSLTGRAAAQTEALKDCSLQDGAVYGPIHSRRLGCSLGINPLPVSYKFCDFDCVYCQYGWTPKQGGGERIKRLPELLAEIDNAFRHHLEIKTPVECLTIAGNGEPTLYPEFEGLVRSLLLMRDQYFPGTRIGILTDGAQIGRAEIRRSLELIDDRFMKLDAGTAETVAKINKPLGRFRFEAMIEELKTLPDFVIQSIFMQGSYDNTSEEDIAAWTRTLQELNPREVQVYTIDRQPADPGLKKVSVARLEEIAAACRSATGIPSIVYN